LLKRIALYLPAFLTIALVVTFFLGLLGFGPLRKPSRESVRRVMSRQKALAALGDIRIDPTGLTYGKLTEILHQPGQRDAGSQNLARLKWACGGDDCAIWASFHLRPSEELSAASPAVALYVSDETLSDPHVVSIGGVFLGEPVDQFLEFCRDAGYAVNGLKKTVTWDKGWNVAWEDRNERIVSIYFLNVSEFEVGTARN